MNTMIKIVTAVQVLLTLLISAFVVASDNPPIAQTEQGTYTGQQTTIDGVIINYWYGIPYAQQPSDNLRWMPTQPLATSNGTNSAVTPNACPQASGFILMTESCLSLNVYAPAAARNVSVFVWIHGGSFTSGAGVHYNATPFVSRSALNSVPVIVVTINYRLGLLGFLADNGLYAEKSGVGNRSTTGNYGILDQIMALDWVKKNIAGFGGNPDKITIGGESAGGQSVLGLLASRLVAPGAFHKAIVQSGAFWDNSNSNLQSAISSTGEFLRTNLGCSTVQCLRNATVTRILVAQTILGSKNIFGIPATPINDGYVFNSTWEDGFASGAFQRVPLLIGILNRWLLAVKYRRLFLNCTVPPSPMRFQTFTVRFPAIPIRWRI
jgi:carboxylesterase type B